MRGGSAPTSPRISTWGVGARISHNLIHDGPHMALSAGGNDHVVEYNEIHNVVYESRDAGAFYVGRDFTQRGTVLSYNYWHQILGAEGHGGMTIYLDDQQSGHHIHGNLFESVTNAVFIGGGVDNTVTNNVFIDCWTAVHLDNRGMGWQKGDGPGHLVDLPQGAAGGAVQRARSGRGATRPCRGFSTTCWGCRSATCSAATSAPAASGTTSTTPPGSSRPYRTTSPSTTTRNGSAW